jgi:hypothetical protein
MTVQFAKATKWQARLRMAIDGPAGSGKTYTALCFGCALARHRGGRLAVIDTERRSGSKYADRYDFDVVELDSFQPERYAEAIEAAERAGYPVIVVDSLSHAWEGEGGVLSLVDQATRRSQSGNSFAAWAEVTPRHRALVDALLQSTSDILATMRTKTEYVLEANARGKMVPQRKGTKPVQREGIDYEFDIVADMTADSHDLIVTKSRCPAVADQVVEKPGEAWFQQVIDWLVQGEEEPRWCQDPEGQARFWAWAEEQALAREEVLTALDVEVLADYRGSKAEALDVLTAHLASREAVAVEQWPI